MKSGVVARWLRRAEIALSVLGVSLLGGALAAIVNTRDYQARQGRAFSDMEQRAAVTTHGPGSPAPGPRVHPLWRSRGIGTPSSARCGTSRSMT